MKRSSSKLISKAGSVRNINKAGFKFNYELHIESVDKMMGSSDVVITWERGPKLLCTRPSKIDKTSRTAHFGGQVLSQEVTLYKRKKEGSKFEPKVFKLTVRSNNERGKVIGKIEINFSDYVEIPSFDKRIAAPISSGARIILRVISTYIGEAKSRRTSKGTVSVDSRDPESDGQSSALEDDDVHSELDADLNLADLDVDDSVPPAPFPPSSQQVMKKNPSLRGHRNRLPNYSVQQEELHQNTATNKLRRKISTQSPKRELQMSNGSNSVETSSMVTVGRLSGGGGVRAARGEVEVGATNGGVPSRSEFEKLRRENRVLRRKNEDLAQQNTELERKIEDFTSMDDSGESIEQLILENTALKRDVGDLESKLAREPVYSDVVKDLREAKMALAILSLEKDELIQALRKRKQGR